MIRLQMPSSFLLLSSVSTIFSSPVNPLPVCCADPVALVRCFSLSHRKSFSCSDILGRPCFLYSREYFSEERFLSWIFLMTRPFLPGDSVEYGAPALFHFFPPFRIDDGVVPDSKMLPSSPLLLDFLFQRCRTGRQLRHAPLDSRLVPPWPGRVRWITLPQDFFPFFPKEPSFESSRPYIFFRSRRDVCSPEKKFKSGLQGLF